MAKNRVVITREGNTFSIWSTDRDVSILFLDYEDNTEDISPENFKFITSHRITDNDPIQGYGSTDSLFKQFKKERKYK